MMATVHQQNAFPVQFVDFTKLARMAAQQQFTPAQWEAGFSLMALMEIPDQYARIKELGLLRTRAPLPEAAQNVPVSDPPR